VVGVLLVLAPAQAVRAQPEASSQPGTFTRSTADGVYTTAQAKRGADIYAGMCQSCHTAASHTGPPFRNKWVGRPLSDLFSFMTQEMPKTEPGSLTAEEYTLVLAYMLRMNGMPAGRRALSPEQAALQAIRIELPLTTDSAEHQRR
jgi:mono/diheme cytochrome c family protein